MRRLAIMFCTFVMLVTFVNLKGETISEESQKTAQYYYVITGD